MTISINNNWNINAEIKINEDSDIYEHMDSVIGALIIQGFTPEVILKGLNKKVEDFKINLDDRI